MFSAVYTLTPPAAEPVSLAQAKAHCRIDNTADDALIPIYITSARRWAEEWTGQAFVTQTLRWVSAQTPPPATQYPYIGLNPALLIYPQWLSFPLLPRRAMQLPRPPVQSVVQVAVGQWGQTDTILYTSAYDVDPTTGRVHIHPGALPTPNDHIAIDFVAGVDASLVPMPIVHAILLLVGFFYERRGDEGGEMPMAVEALLSPFRQRTFA